MATGYRYKFKTCKKRFNNNKIMHDYGKKECTKRKVKINCYTNEWEWW